nr:MAG TPA: hypothetical protein [Caudoviricetes sp.]DAU03758.1 MAG TPA: hypothetical protein [Caudoviricetes sp.]
MTISNFSATRSYLYIVTRFLIICSRFYWSLCHTISSFLLKFLTKTVRGPSQSYYSKLGENYLSLETDIGG